VTKRQKKE